jgi:hypothetical protein
MGDKRKYALLISDQEAPRETAMQLQHRAANPRGNPSPHDLQLVMSWPLVDKLLFNDKESFLDLIAADTSSNDSFRFEKKGMRVTYIY